MAISRHVNNAHLLFWCHYKSPGWSFCLSKYQLSRDNSPFYLSYSLFLPPLGDCRGLIWPCVRLTTPAHGSPSPSMGLPPARDPTPAVGRPSANAVFSCFSVKTWKPAHGMIMMDPFFLRRAKNRSELDENHLKYHKNFVHFN